MWLRFVVFACFLALSVAVPLQGDSLDWNEIGDGESIKKLPDPVDPNEQLIWELFYHTVESLVEHTVKSRDPNKQFAGIRIKRQSNFNSNLLSQLGNGLGALGGSSALSGLAGLGGLNGFGQQQLQQLLQQQQSPASSGINFFNTAATAITKLDRLNCVPRLVCETTVVGVNGTSQFLRNMTRRAQLQNKNNTQSVNVTRLPENNIGQALNLSDPTTLKSVIGMMKFLNVNQQPAYPFLEAALHGISHRDHQKCRSHFSKCPADTDKFIDQLNTTPGGVQGVLANVAEVVRPPVAANVAEGAAASTGASSNLLSAFGGLANGLGGLGNGFGGLQNGFGGSQNSNGGLQNGFGGLQNGFGGLQNGFGGLQNGFGGSQNGFGGLQNGFGGLQNGFGGSQNVNGGFSGHFGNGASSNFLANNANQQQLFHPSLSGNHQFLNNQQFLTQAGTNFASPQGSFSHLNLGSNNFVPGTGGFNTVTGFDPGQLQHLQAGQQFYSGNHLNLAGQSPNPGQTLHFNPSSASFSPQFHNQLGSFQTGQVLNTFPSGQQNFLTSPNFISRRLDDSTNGEQQENRPSWKWSSSD